MSLSTVFVNADAVLDVSGEVLDLLYADVVGKLADELGNEFANEAEANKLCKYITFKTLNKTHFNRAYDYLLEAVNTHDELSSVKADLVKAFKDDLRFKEVQAA